MKIGGIYININNKNKKLIIIKEILTIISISVILPLILFKIYVIADITGKSMENTLKDNELYLNNKIVNEPYIKEKMESTDYNKITIPTGKVFVMGDNRNKSVDSRSSTIGLIDVNDIEGKVIFKLPFFNKIQ